MSSAVVRRSTLDDAEFHENGNGHALAPAATVEIASTRAAQEVQASMVIAKKFPRDENAAYTRIMKACRRRGLAEAAIYEYPRGGEKVTGPSIRLAEAMAQAWGNMDFGIVELEQRDRESQVMAFAWDLETNTRQTKVFTVPHERHTRQGVKDLTDPRDVYELVANQGARRLRACILGVIPGDVIDAAVRECHKTVTSQSGEPLADRVRSMVVAFAELGVVQQMIEARLGHNLDAVSEHQLAGLRRVYQSIRDGMAGVDQFFSKGKSPADSKLDNLPDPPPRQQQQPKQSQAETPPLSAGPAQTDAADDTPQPPKSSPAKDRAVEPPTASASGPAEEEGRPAPAESRDMKIAEWARWFEGAEEAAMAAGVPNGVLSAGIERCVLAKGKKGKAFDLPQEIRDRLMNEIKTKTGYFAG